MTVSELKTRLESDENMFLKIQEQANRQHSESLNQIAEVYRIALRMSDRLEKLEIRIKQLENK